MKKTGEKYRCNICGNEVVVTKAGGGTLGMLRRRYAACRVALILASLESLK